MTLIIGVRCSNGIVLGSDRKILRGGEVEYSNKLYEINNIAYAVEGLTGIAEDFLNLFELEIRRRRGVDTLYEAKILAEDIVGELTERYAERVESGSPIGILMGGLSGLISGEAQLYYIHSRGYGEKTYFICSGHGGSYATTLAKFMLDRSFDVHENARRVAFIIAYIAEDVDVTVGGQPHIAIIKDAKQESVEKPIQYLSESEVDEMINKARDCKAKLPQLLGFR